MSARKYDVDEAELQSLVEMHKAGKDVSYELVPLLQIIVGGLINSMWSSLCGEREDLLQVAIIDLMDKLKVSYDRSRGTVFNFVDKVAANKMRDYSRAERRSRRAMRALLESAERDPYVARTFT
jgi:DNA-directed RNA polymerase specialized sigma subunit